MENQPNSNPSCRHCGAKTYHNRDLKKGGVRYLCSACGKYTSVGAAKVGAPKKDKPLSQAERKRKYMDSLSSEERAAYVEKNRVRRLELRRAKKKKASS